MPLPSPVPPPVTKTTLSLNESGGSIVLVLAAKWADCGPLVTSGLLFDIVVEKYLASFGPRPCSPRLNRGENILLAIITI